MLDLFDLTTGFFQRGVTIPPPPPPHGGPFGIVSDSLTDKMKALNELTVSQACVADFSGQAVR